MPTRFSLGHHHRRVAMRRASPRLYVLVSAGTIARAGARAERVAPWGWAQQGMLGERATFAITSPDLPGEVGAQRRVRDLAQKNRFGSATACENFLIAPASRQIASRGASGPRQ